MWWISVLASAAPPAIPDRAPDQTFHGEIAAGQVLPLDWAAQSNVACFAALQRPKYAGPHQWFVLPQAVATDLIVRVRPSSGVDINTWALQNGGVTVGQRPPSVSATWRCTSSWFAGPGQPEVFRLSAGNGALEAVIGVAGVDPAATGSFDVEVWQVPGRTYGTP